MEFLNYLLKVSACSALFFAFYLLVLRKLTFFKINRFYLLITLLLSFTIPTLHFNLEMQVAVQQPTEMITPATSQIELAPVFGGPTTIAEIGSPIKESFDWLVLLPYCYGLVVISLLCLAIWRLVLLLKHARKNIQEVNGLKLVYKSVGFTNCSFFNYVFIDENSLNKNELQVLLAHEEIHAKQFHSIDKIILMIAKAVLWFNPIVYFYDKALEQTHEFEADEATSQNFGTEPYANLLLRLAIAKSEMPLVHNFVKSPVKERIKMLFNSKTKDMKKLIYLLALPIGLGLLWGFTVDVVEVFPASTLDGQTLLKNQSINRDTLLGKKVTGIVTSFEIVGKTKVFNLKTVNRIYPISMFGMTAEIKVGDELIVRLDGTTSPPMPIGEDIKKWEAATKNGVNAYITTSITNINGEIVYAYKPVYHAFGFEANRARYANSKIKSIQKNSDGTINKIVLNDKGFTINLNVADQKFKSNNFKVGDAVSVKFIGEKLIATNTYSTDKMIVLYSWPKKYELMNEKLFDKFYFEDGRQKVAKTPAKIEKVGNDDVKVSPYIVNKPKDIPLSDAYILLANLKKGNDSLKSYTVMGNSLFVKGNIKLNIDGFLLAAKFINVEKYSNLITAHIATLTSPDGSSLIGDEIVFDVTNKLAKTTKTKGYYKSN